MRNLPRRVVVLIVGALVMLPLVAPAQARKLTHDEIVRAAEAAEARLPPVDAVAFASCRIRYASAFGVSQPGPGARTLAEVATCFRAAGALTMAMIFWEEVVRRFRDTDDAREASRQLGLVNETAGRFEQAARWFYLYATAPEDLSGMESARTAQDRRAFLVRAICLYRQLGKDEEADRELKRLQWSWRRTKVDAATLCDGVPPIEVPPAPAAR